MRTPLLAVTLSLAIAAAGCADSQSASPDTSEAPSAQPTEVASVSGTDGAALERVSTAAANTVEAGTARFTLTVEGADSGGGEEAQAVIAEGEEDFAEQLRLVTFTGEAGELRTVVDDTTVYVELPATEGDDWARLELSELLDDVGFGGPGGLPFQSSADNLEALETAIVAAAEGATEEVQGAPATRYDLRIDLEQAAQNSAGEVNDTFAATAEASGVTELDMAVWIDESDHISRVTYALDLSQAEDVEVATEDAEVDVEPTGQVSVTVEYYDIGADLDIEVPDEASIVDIDEDAIRDSFEQ